MDGAGRKRQGAALGSKVGALTNRFDLIAVTPCSNTTKSNFKKDPVVKPAISGGVRAVIDIFEKASTPITSIHKTTQQKPLMPRMVTSPAATVNTRKVDSTVQTDEKNESEEESDMFNSNSDKSDVCAPYTVQLRKQINEKLLVEDRLKKENILIQTSPASVTRTDSVLSQLLKTKNRSPTKIDCSVFNRFALQRISTIRKNNKRGTSFIQNELERTSAIMNMTENKSFLWSANITPRNSASFLKSNESEMTDCEDDIESVANVGPPVYSITDELDSFNIYDSVESENIYESVEELKNGRTSLISDDDIYASVEEVKNDQANGRTSLINEDTVYASVEELKNDRTTLISNEDTQVEETVDELENNYRTFSFLSLRKSTNSVSTGAITSLISFSLLPDLGPENTEHGINDDKVENTSALSDISPVSKNTPNDSSKISPERGLLSHHALHRTLWRQMPDVETSGIASTLTDKQRKLQEAKFEIFTSECSYVHGLNVLQAQFMSNLTELITPRDHKLLFTNILAVKSVSECLYRDLESIWIQDIMLRGICDVIREHAERIAEVFVRFFKNQTAVFATLSYLLETNSKFSAAVKKLESSDVCCGLRFDSFLVLPTQRITRLPLLIEAVVKHLEEQDDEYESSKTAFEVLSKIVKDCNEEATKMEKCEEMLLLRQQLVFPKAVRQIPVISGDRCVVKRGAAVLLVAKDDSKRTFGRKLSKVPVHLLLFTDLLLLARNTGRGELSVIDFCARNLVQLQKTSGVYLGTGYAGILTLLENHENKTVEMVMLFSLESDMTRWQDVLSVDPMESIYEAWNCPQMVAIYDFTAEEPDELSLSIGDKVNVLKKIPDGWYQGERLRDGARGWFPCNFAQEISPSHVQI